MTALTPGTKKIGLSTLYRFGDTPKAVINKLGMPHNLSESEWSYIDIGECYIKDIEYHYKDVSFYFIALSDRPTNDLYSHEVNIYIKGLVFHTPRYEILGVRVGDVGINSVLQKMEPYCRFYFDQFNEESGNYFVEFYDPLPDPMASGFSFSFDEHETIKKISAWEDTF